MQGLIGLFFFIAIGWTLSSARKSISWKKIFRLAFSQLILMGLFLIVPGIRKGFHILSHGFEVFSQAARAGTAFVFGYLGGDTPPFLLAEDKGSTFIFMFQALPMIVVMGALSMLLFHWKILPLVMRSLSQGAQKLWSIGGALATAMAAKLFLGQSDTPLLIRPYLSHLSRNELFSIMTAGMATASASIFALYATLMDKSLGFSHAMTHILVATVVNIPSSLIIAELLIPEEHPMTQGQLASPYTFSNSMEAIAQGTQEGWNVMWGVGAILIVSLTFVKLVNIGLSFLTSLILDQALSLETVLGYLFRPWMWAIGIPSEEALPAGSLLAIKIIFNEVIAFAHIRSLTTLSPRSLSILIYSLLGFGNLSSIGIQVAGLSSLVPERRKEIGALAPRALGASLLAGSLNSALLSLIYELGAFH